MWTHTDSLAAVVSPAVVDVVTGKNYSSDKYPLRVHLHKPGKWSATQIEQKEWWIAEWRKDTSAVGNQHDKDKECVDFMLSVAVHLKQRTHEQHCSTRCADKRCKGITDKEHSCIYRRCCDRVTCELNTTRNNKERTEQYYKRDVVVEHLV